MASKNAEARIAAGERRQKRLEEYLSEITSTVARLCRESQERWTLGIADGESLQRQVQVLEDRCLELPKLAMERTAFEERMKAVEACCMDLPEVKVRLKTLEDHAMVSPDKDPSESKQKKRNDELVLAVQALESLLNQELKATRKICNNLQDTMHTEVLVPLTDIDQRLQEQDQVVKQLISIGQDGSSRVEEHEFRLGVLRTKLDVHDQKFSRLELMRCNRRCNDLEHDCGPLEYDCSSTCDQQ